VEEIWVNGSKAEYFVDKNNMKQGTLKVYFHTGEIWMIEEYKNNKLNGMRKIFSLNHKKCRIQKFTDGLLIEDSGNFDV
jgi:antitoxin component YwqK of YwqJK toxin-antitoxin module